MIVVSNASPLLALAQADRLSILKALFEHLLIPEAVRRETVDQCRVPEQRQRIEAAIHTLRRSASHDITLSPILPTGWSYSVRSPGELANKMARTRISKAQGKTWPSAF